MNHSSTEISQTFNIGHSANYNVAQETTLNFDVNVGNLDQDALYQQWQKMHREAVETGSWNEFDEFGGEIDNEEYYEEDLDDDLQEGDDRYLNEMDDADE